MPVQRIYTLKSIGFSLASVLLAATSAYAAHPDQIKATPPHRAALVKGQDTMRAAGINPSNLRYLTTEFSFLKGKSIEKLVPRYEGKAYSSYAAAPALPAGLSINASTGEITGTPTTVTAATNYVIAGKYKDGDEEKTDTIILNMAVQDTVQPGFYNADKDYYDGAIVWKKITSTPHNYVNAVEYCAGLPPTSGTKAWHLPTDLALVNNFWYDHVLKKSAEFIKAGWVLGPTGAWVNPKDKVPSWGSGDLTYKSKEGILKAPLAESTSLLVTCVNAL